MYTQSEFVYIRSVVTKKNSRHFYEVTFIKRQIYFHHSRTKLNLLCIISAQGKVNPQVPHSRINDFKDYKEEEKEHCTAISLIF